MTKKFFLFFLLCFCWLRLTANHELPGSANITTGQIPGMVVCSLPAPTNLHVTSATSASVSIAWNPVVGAIGYYAAALDDLGQVVLDDATVSTTAATLFPGTSGPIMVRVYAICEDQSNSCFYAQMTNVYLIATELIVEMAAPCEPNDLFYLIEGTISPPWVNGGKYWFDVVDPQGYISEYGIEMEPYDNQNYKITVGQVDAMTYRNGWHSLPTGSDGLGLDFDPPVVQDFYFMKVSRDLEQTVDLYQITYEKFDDCSGMGACLNVEFDQLSGASGYGIVFKSGTDCFEFKNQPEDRTALSFASPNRPVVQSPFSAELSIRNIDPKDKTVHVSLFDLGGRIALDTYLPAATDYSLNTAGLSPGFYLLQLKNGEDVQSFKVVKQ